MVQYQAGPVAVCENIEQAFTFLKLLEQCVLSKHMVKECDCSKRDTLCVCVQDDMRSATTIGSSLITKASSVVTDSALTASGSTTASKSRMNSWGQDACFVPVLLNSAKE